MYQLTTFEDIFNHLLEDYQGSEVEVVTRQGGLNISRFRTVIGGISIKPLRPEESQRWLSGGKVGLLVIETSPGRDSVNIPFILGYNTMSAVFLKDCVTIKTLKMEFIIKKVSRGSRRLA